MALTPPTALPPPTRGHGNQMHRWAQPQHDWENNHRQSPVPRGTDPLTGPKPRAMALAPEMAHVEAGLVDTLAF